MDAEAEKKLAALNADYESVTGRKPNHFFCPILFRDEKVELCKAHIINSSFPNSDRSWTIQRADVDSRFGSILESDFVKLQYRGKYHPRDVLINQTLAKQLRPKFILNGKEVYHFPVNGSVPKGFSRITVDDISASVDFALKISPKETLAALNKNCQLEIRADLRLPALGSLLKAAHLTLFEIFGYRYALSSAGHFMGYTILGDFFLETVDLPKKGALEIGHEHFFKFVNLVRPSLKGPTALKGTITDRLFFLCMQGAAPWAMAVLVRTDDKTHAVLVPVFEEAERSAQFLRFMNNPAASTIEDVRLARFAGDHWEIFPTANRFHWPEANFL